MVARITPSEITLAVKNGHSDKGLGARLKEIREARNLSREQFGAELSTHRNTIERYEKGVRPPDSDFLHRVIEKNPEWRLEWLITGSGNKKNGERGAHHLESPQPVAYGSTINEQLLAQVIREIEAAFGNRLEGVSVDKRATLIAAVYDDAIERGSVSREIVLRLVKLAR